MPHLELSRNMSDAVRSVKLQCCSVAVVSIHQRRRTCEGALLLLGCCPLAASRTNHMPCSPEALQTLFNVLCRL